jgi:hypothetical protein
MEGNMKVIRGRMSKNRLPGVSVRWMIQARVKASVRHTKDEPPAKMSVLISNVRFWGVVKASTKNSVVRKPGAPGKELQNIPKNRNPIGTTIRKDATAEITSTTGDVCNCIPFRGDDT